MAEKNDLATKEYRRGYMKYKIITLRHPENGKWRNSLKS